MLGWIDRHSTMQRQILVLVQWQSATWTVGKALCYVKSYGAKTVGWSVNKAELLSCGQPTDSSKGSYHQNESFVQLCSLVLNILLFYTDKVCHFHHRRTAHCFYHTITA